jgi:hypothetical protein
MHPIAVVSRGNMPFAELRSCFKLVPDDFAAIVHLEEAESIWHRYHGRTAEALQHAEEAAALVHKHWLVMDHSITAIPNLANALRDHADAIQIEDARHCVQLRKRAAKVALWAVRTGSLLQHALPYSLRELSHTYVQKGKKKKAHCLAEKSCRVAERQGAQMQYAESLLLCGILGEELGLPESTKQIEKARKQLAAFEEETIPRTMGEFYGGRQISRPDRRRSDRPH